MKNIYLMRGKNGENLAKNNNYTAIVVDALRASSTLTSILTCHPKDLIVVAKLEDSYKLKEQIDDAILIGERNNLPPTGFTFGNSPLEILGNARNIKNKTVIFTTSNGAQRLINAKGVSNYLFMGTISTSKTIAKKVTDSKIDNIVIISAGLYGDEDYISEEDDLASSIIAREIISINSEYTISKISAINYEENINFLSCNSIENIFCASKHGKKLAAQNLSDDIAHCASIQPINILPKAAEYVKLNNRIVGVKIATH